MMSRGGSLCAGSSMSWRALTRRSDRCVVVPPASEWDCEGWRSVDWVSHQLHGLLCGAPPATVRLSHQGCLACSAGAAARGRGAGGGAEAAGWHGGGAGQVSAEALRGWCLLLSCRLPAHRCLLTLRPELRLRTFLCRLLATVPETEMQKAQRVVEAIELLDGEAGAEETAASQLDKLL